jgi:hypothetical protein
MQAGRAQQHTSSSSRRTHACPAMDMRCQLHRILLLLLLLLLLSPAAQ